MAIIRLRPITLPWYGDMKPRRFWLDENVRDLFDEAIRKWQETHTSKYIVTEMFRTIKRQAAAKRAKPRLCTAPGWSMHGLGRAVDGHIRPGENGKSLLEFYQHMQKWGWYTIFNFPGKSVNFQSRESWHVQKTDPVGIRSVDYITAWAKKEGILDKLLAVKKNHRLWPDVVKSIEYVYLGA